MSKLKVCTIITLLIITVIIIFHYTSFEKMDYVVNGAIDLEERLNKQNVITLDGDWEFYENKLLSPSDFINDDELEPEMIRVPGNWGSDNGVNERGYGTYRLVLNNLVVDQEYGFVKKNIRMTSIIFINGEKVFQDGVPSETQEAEVFGNLPKTIHFLPDHESVEIVIQVSNFSYYSGGIVESLKIGAIEDVDTQQKKQLIFEMGILTYLLVIVITLGVLVVLFQEFRDEKSASYFMPLTVFAFTIINGSLGERLIKVIFSSISTEMLIRIEYIAVSTLLISLTVSIHLMDKKLLSRKFTGAVSFIYLVFAILVVVSNGDNHLIWNLCSAITLIVLPLEFLIVGYRYIKSENINVEEEEHSLILLILYLINIYNLDVLMFTFGFKDNLQLSLIAAGVFAFVWFLLIVYRYSLTIKKNNEISAKLIESYYDIEKNTYESRRHEMAFLQAQVKPHFLFNTLNGIIALCTFDPKRAKDLMMNLSQYLKHLFNIDRDTEYIYLDSEINLVKTYISIEKERFGKRFHFDLDINGQTDTIKIVPLLIQPIVENAMRHGALQRSENGKVSLTILVVENELMVTIIDNGYGISSRKIDEIYNYVPPKDEIGIGLKNIIDRLKLYYNEVLHIEETEDGGTKVWFKIYGVVEEDYD